jgi:hypothetical protein
MGIYDQSEQDRQMRMYAQQQMDRLGATGYPTPPLGGLAQIEQKAKSQSDDKRLLLLETEL